MKPSLIAMAVCFSLYSPLNYANVQPNAECLDPCLVNVPQFEGEIKDDSKNSPIEVSADSFEAVLPNKGVYTGNVIINQGNRTVESQKITINQDDENNRNIELQDNVSFKDNNLNMTGDFATFNLNTNDVEINNSQYHLVGRLGRGSAQKMQFKNNRFIILEEGSFTSCPINDSSWNIEGSKIIHDNEEQLLEVWNAVFRVGKVPVFYSPYLQLPTGSKRRSGLLIPKISYDSVDGIDFSQPIYWNIANNYDATFTPRYIQRRGVHLKNEVRYLNEIGLGTIAFDWMQHDSLYNKDRSPNNGALHGDNDHRWLFHWRNEELINYNWRFNVDTTRVSDYQYINDLGSNYASETDGYLNQSYKIGFNDEHWDIALNYRNFQALSDGLKDNLYRTVPQLNINYFNYDLDDFTFKTFAQVSHFTTSGNDNPKTWRYHLEPTVDYTLLSSWATVTTQAGFMATHYDQDLPDNVSNDHLKSSVNRFMPKFSIDGKIIFERDVDSLTGYTQTLEPRIKYLYIPYRNQSHTQSYDSSLLQSDYIGLFRDQIYSGLDRIASANRLSSGITTRFYDENKVERFNLSLGQIYHFTHSRTGDNKSPLDQNQETGSITWATDAYWRMDDNFIFRSGIQYDTRMDEVSLANATFEYRENDRKMAQLSYRYANKNYIDSINSINTPYQQDLSQLGITSSWPLTDTITAVGSYFYDLENNKVSDSYIGFNYADCCWGVSLQYGRKINGWNSNTAESVYENRFSINVELRGLGRKSNAVAKMLDFGLLPYNTAFEQDFGTY
ncbi:LPS assembly protein LptD [Orbaceae bacterium ac157xtp]